jgi:hypothetical protein
MEWTVFVGVRGRASICRTRIGRSFGRPLPDVVWSREGEGDLTALECGERVVSIQLLQLGVTLGVLGQGNGCQEREKKGRKEREPTKNREMGQQQVGGEGKEQATEKVCIKGRFLKEGDASLPLCPLSQ